MKPSIIIAHVDGSGTAGLTTALGSKAWTLVRLESPMFSVAFIRLLPVGNPFGSKLFGTPSNNLTVTFLPPNSKLIFA